MLRFAIVCGASWLCFNAQTVVAQVVQPTKPPPPKPAVAVDKKSVAPVGEVDTVIASLLEEMDRRRRTGLRDDAPLMSASPATLAAIEAAAAKKQPDAMYLMGVCACAGIGGPRDYVKGVKLIEEAARAGSTAAMVDFASIAWLNTNDRKLQREILQRARDEGNRAAGAELNLLLASDALDQGDIATAEKIYRNMAGAGDPQMKWRLAEFLFLTADTPQRAQEAREWLTRAADAGHMYATSELGVQHYLGLGVPADPRRGMALLEKAANAGSPRAMMALAEFLLQTRESAKVPLAKKWIDTAVATNDLRSMGLAAEWFAIGDVIGRDAKRAWELANAAVARGYAPSYIIQSYMHREGVGVSKSASDGFRAARKGALAGVPRAMNELACYYRFGWSVPHDEAEAIKWWEKGARLGDALCLNSLGLRYSSGRGVKIDHKRAFEYFYRAAVSSNGYTAINVGRAYQYGMGVEKNLPLAIEWYKSAYSGKQMQGAVNLAVVYLYDDPRYRNVADGLRLLREAAAANDPSGVRFLADVYDQGIHAPRDLPRAFELYKKAAKLGDASATRAVANALLHGRGVAKQPEEALRYLKDAAMSGDGDAYAEIGVIHLWGLGVPRDPEKALVNLKKAAELGSNRGRVILGGAYRDGFGVEVNRAEAIRILTEAHESGDLGEAAMELALVYVRGAGGEKPDDENAIKWLKKSAELKFARGCTELSDAYMSGIRVPADIPMGISLLREAAEKRYAPAENRLGLLYRNGRGVPKDIKQAAEWFERAADEEPRAFENHADMLLDEKLDAKQAIALYERGAAAGRTSCSVKLARYYIASGDITKGTALAAAAAEAGDPAGMTLHGLIIQEKDPATAAPWLVKAAGLNDPDAMFALGAMYERGLHFPQDDKAAAEWFRRGAEKGHPASMYTFGVYNAMGRGVPKNEPLGVDWLKKAARRGHPDAQQTLKNNNISWEG